MRQRIWFSALLLGTCLAASARGEVSLQWNLKKGDQFYFEDSVLQKQALKFMGTDLKQELSFTRVTRFTVLDKKDRGFVLEQKIITVRVNQDMGAGTAEARLLKQMEGATFKLTLGPDLRVTRFEGYEDLVKRISTDEKVARMIQSLLPREMLARASESYFVFLPEKPVQPGARWDLATIRSLGPLGSLRIDNTCTWKESAKSGGKELAAIEVVPQKSTYVQPREKEAAFQVIKGDIRVDTEKTRTAIAFNIALGRPVRVERTVLLFGTITVESMGVSLTMDVEHEETINTRFLDKAPLSK